MSRQVRTLNPRVTGASQVPTICSSGVALITIPAPRRGGSDGVELISDDGSDDTSTPLFALRRPFEAPGQALAVALPPLGRLPRASAWLRRFRGA